MVLIIFTGIPGCGKQEGFDALHHVSIENDSFVIREWNNASQ